ncbi:MAG: metal ABC transporter ATP-binding protein [Patescibacteria group bacterium]|nr:metal ABC transporter ATP-binding protein [Patescibacteria group bacterium]MCL5262011.1 metal ABC transporter ATP-binding protein [Patescibacteria group bacterium]
MPDILEVKNLSVAFGQIKILSHLSFSVKEASTLAVIGPNGAGKTLLFRALIGAERHSGEVVWKPGIKIGYIPQKLDLERDLPVTALELLMAKAAIVKLGAKHVDESLKLVDLPIKDARQPIGNLSGGQFQRALIAFALIGEPEVLLFDEPTAGVDAPGQEKIYELTNRLKKEKHLTVIIISHDLSLVYEYADEVLCLNREKICFGKPQEVLEPQALEKLYGSPHKYYIHNDHRN